MHYFPWKPSAYQKDTAHLTVEEDLCFRRLLDHQYLTELPIPLETESVSRRLRMGKQLVEAVLSEFFERTENGWWNCKAKEVIEQYAHNREVNRTNGKQGGRPKKTHSVSSRKPKKKPTESDTKGNHEPRTSNQVVSGFAFPPEWSEQRRSDVETFITYRRTVLKKPLKPQTFPAWVRKYAEFDDATMRAAINDSMAEGYQGIFPEKHLPRPRREGAWNPTFEKKGGVGPAPAAHPLAVPPCAEWKSIARIVCERAGIEDFTWLDEANWTELASDDRQAVVDEWKYREEARAGGAA